MLRMDSVGQEGSVGQEVAPFPFLWWTIFADSLTFFPRWATPQGTGGTARVLWCRTS